ncbi:TPA: hypothetical protein N0F65_009071 [Lagenidium giganteum]|uniref:Chromo domain-containing protein n=1 Tax=Lagenidium giganteum TaxID=4803 RepID=A0AAV2YRM1_9STRA|nr:TPA: hypothetical protein N0F65_009071 [Lagenidium giganteum]
MPHTTVSRKKFKDACSHVLRTSFGSMRFDDEAMRYLRADLKFDASQCDLCEVLLVRFGALASQGIKRLNAVIGVTCRGQLSPAQSESSEDEEDGETEFQATQDLAPTPLWNVSKIHDRYREKGTTYYLVEWQPKWEQRANIAPGLIAKFEKERRALVCKIYIEGGAEEAGKRRQ